MNYPNPKKEDDSYSLHGNKIQDDYAWMEKESKELNTWIQEENKLSNNFFNNLQRDEIKKRLYEISNFEKKSSYFEQNGNQFYFKNTGLENHSILYIKYKDSEKEEIFLDPNTFSKDGTAPLVSISFSKNGKYCGYGVAKAGGDWTEIKVREIATKNDLPETIKGVKFDTDVFCNGVSFYKNGFFYPSYAQDINDINYTSKDEPGKIYFHKLNTSQDEDELIFENKEAKNLIIGAVVDFDQKNLIISTSTGCIGNDIYISSLNDYLNFKQIVDNYDNKYEYLGSIRNEHFFLTNNKAKNRKIISYKNEFKDIIEEGEIPIESAKLIGNKILIEKLINVQSKVFFYNLQGELIKEISMPDFGTFLGCSGKIDSKEGYFSASSFLSPTKIYKINFETLDYELFEETKINFDFEKYQVVQKFATSKDGTKVPMFIVSKKNLKLNSNNPTILYGYGGFNISLLPTFSSKILSWIELGGVFVMSNLRGGGEYGEQWHEAGKKHNKQNVFDDCFACAEYLHSHNYCSPSSLAISGGSNGGLLAAACALQRPDLFKVSLPAAAVLDMLKFHTFTCGYQWTDEYGTIEKEEDFETLYNYSPYHNIKENNNYPSFLVTCSDFDDRVVPAHSYKFMAKLQELNPNNLHLLRVEVNSSHGASNLTKYLDESADTWYFILKNFN